MGTLLKNKNVTVGALYNILTSYWTDVLQNIGDKEHAHRQTSLFDYIRNSLLFQEDTDIEDEATENLTNNVLERNYEQELFPSQEDHQEKSSTPTKKTKTQIISTTKQQKS